MIDSYETVVSRRPFQVRRRVRWSECDPAGVVYTGRFAEFMLGAVNLFYANLVQEGYRSLTRRLGIDTPCRGLDLDFRGALWPEDEFVMTVTVAAVRRSTFDLRIEAVQDDGREVFVGRFTPVCIAREGERRSVPLPQPYAQALEAHRPAPPLHTEGAGVVAVGLPGCCPT